MKIELSHKLWLPLLLAVLIASVTWAAAPINPTPDPALTVVLVGPEMVTPHGLAQWKAEGFRAVAVLLGEHTPEAGYRAVGQAVRDAGLDLFYWIEIGR